MAKYLHHNHIVGAVVLARNLRAEGEESRAYFIEELMNECLRLRQGLWDVARVCGEDLDGNETPASLDSDIVEFAVNAATELRDQEDIALDEWRVMRAALQAFIGLFPDRPVDDGTGGMGWKPEVTSVYDNAVAVLKGEADGKSVDP